MTRCLFVRPAAGREAQGGDEIVYQRTCAYIAERMDLEVFELAPVGRPRQLAAALTGVPPEVTGYWSRANAKRLSRRLQAGGIDAVCFSHEATFPFSQLVSDPKTRKILCAHNTLSLMAATDPSLIGRLLRPLAIAYERRWYGDPTAALICISRADAAGLRAVGVKRSEILVCPPGAPSAEPLAPAAGLITEAVLTGSYGWWRKRRDLKAFAAGPPIDLPILAADPLAVAILGLQARAVRDGEVAWSQGLRVGLITDRFQGGFKLKSVEYVARNCVVASLCDLSAEFEGLPFAEEFVRHTPSRGELNALFAELAAQPPAELVARFRQFKDACLKRFGWEACLAPLHQALLGAD